MAREVLLPLAKYGGRRPQRRKTKAEEEICCPTARTPRQRVAQAKSFGREQRRSARGTTSHRRDSNGKDAEIAPGRPASLGAKTAAQRLSAQPAGLCQARASLAGTISPLSTDGRNLAPRDRNARLYVSRSGIAKFIENRSRRFRRAAGLSPTAVFPGGRRV